MVMALGNYRPGAPRFALAGFAWRSRAKIATAKRVPRSSSDTRAKTDGLISRYGPQIPISVLLSCADIHTADSGNDHHFNAAVRTGASHNADISASSRLTVSEQPAMSNEVT
ncbi:hypothetical protein ACVIGA_005471 [Bradyrhizobium sp. USDA 3240]